MGKKKEHRINKKIVHQHFNCQSEECKKDDKYLEFPTRKKALLHHRKTGHKVVGEMTYEVLYVKRQEA